MQLNNQPVLVVEDDTSIREVLKTSLEFAGYKVYVAKHGLEAIEMLPHISRPRLILLDLMMPVMNGWEFLDAKEKDDKMAPIPVVVVSAIAQLKPVHTKVAAVIDKPLDLDTLYETVEQYSQNQAA